MNIESDRMIHSFFFRLCSFATLLYMYKMNTHFASGLFDTLYFMVFSFITLLYIYELENRITNLEEHDRNKI